MSYDTCLNTETKEESADYMAACGDNHGHRGRCLTTLKVVDVTKKTKQ